MQQKASRAQKWQQLFPLLLFLQHFALNYFTMPKCLAITLRKYQIHLNQQSWKVQIWKAVVSKFTKESVMSSCARTLYVPSIGPKQVIRERCRLKGPRHHKLSFCYSFCYGEIKDGHLVVFPTSEFCPLFAWRMTIMDTLTMRDMIASCRRIALCRQDCFM